MYLVRLPQGQPAQWLFLHADPIADGCPFEVLEGVEYEDERLGFLNGFGDDPFDRGVVGRSKKDPRSFKRFVSRADLDAERYDRLPGVAVELTSWHSFTRESLREPLQAQEFSFSARPTLPAVAGFWPRTEGTVQ